MKKKILGLAVIAMSMGSLSTMARDTKSANCPANADCPTACQTCPASDAECAPANCTPAHCGRPDPYKGLNLTSAQKEKLDRLDASRRQARVDKAQIRKADRQRNDSLRRADRKSHLEEVKAIVSPDQYVTYLENIVLDTPRGNGNHHKAFTNGGRDHRRFSTTDRKGAKDTKRSEKVKTSATAQK